MFESVLQLDTRIFLLINGAHDEVVDFIMYWTAQKWIWTPFYIWLLYVLIRNYGKKAGWFLPAFAALIVCSDQLSVLIKDSVQRLRPSHEPALQQVIHIVNQQAGGMYGFVSSHAANTMAMAVFLHMILPRGYSDIRKELVAFVLINSYGRIYLGLHYPGDVLGGWILGASVAYVFAKWMQRKLPVPDKVAIGHA